MPNYSKKSLKGNVMTVCGPINPKDLGRVICHEHLLIDFRVVLNEPPNKKDIHYMKEKINLSNIGWIRTYWNSNEDNLLLEDINDSIEEMADFRLNGGHSLVEVTPLGPTRLENQHKKLKLISEKTGINIIMGTGFYVDNSLPDYFNAKSVEELASIIIEDILKGNNGVHSGIIGEVGCSFPLTENEKKSLKSAILAQKETGSAILIHPGRHESSPSEIIDFIQSEDGELSRTIIGHIERTLYDYNNLELLAKTGVYLNFDQLGIESSYYPLNPKKYMPSDHQKLEFIKAISDAGFNNKILLGHDIYSKNRLKKYGGHGYSHAFESLLDRMETIGMSKEKINDIITLNPQKILTFE
tara:strand:+ start:2770 stop:3837 length:1068 start_codon:yes stop_codon:yes gene_type:complete